MDYTPRMIAVQLRISILKTEVSPSNSQNKIISNQFRKDLFQKKIDLQIIKFYNKYLTFRLNRRVWTFKTLLFNFQQFKHLNFNKIQVLRCPNNSITKCLLICLNSKIVPQRKRLSPYFHYQC